MIFRKRTARREVPSGRGKGEGKPSMASEGHFGVSLGPLLAYEGDFGASSEPFRRRKALDGDFDAYVCGLGGAKK